MTNDEIIEQASAIRRESAGASQYVFSASESDIIEQAERITRERQSLGISGLIESAVAAIRGERASAELALQKAREREGEIESLIHQKAGLGKALDREREALQRIETALVDYRKRSTPKAERDAMRSRFHARHEARFGEHLPHAVQGILEARLIAEMLPDYAALCREEIAKLEADIADIDRKITKARK